MSVEGPSRVVAVDWSGDKTTAGQRKKLWIADWTPQGLTLTAGFTREQVGEYLITAARETPAMVAGLDFAFSFPAWFPRDQGCGKIEDFWQLVAAGKAEDWLAQPNSFCWGRKGCRCPAGHRAPLWKGYRRTDREISGASTGGIRPKSPFQIGGAGAVGTGSLRGIPVLHRLRQAGFSVWPFDRCVFPLALEIYPRLFTGKGNKSSPEFRSRHLAGPLYRDLSSEVREPAAASEDAFDALCSVIAMKAHAAEFAALQQARDPDMLLEGQIWTPATLPACEPRHSHEPV